VKVCDEKTGEIIMVKESEADKYLPADSEKCKPAAHTVKVCDAKTGKIITVNESEASAYEAVDSDACKETPTTPATELPKTGSADVFGSVLALGSLTAATYYYVTSRRN
jgi:LPXTG-motif cell wall-anchored protein